MKARGRTTLLLLWAAASCACDNGHQTGPLTQMPQPVGFGESAEETAPLDNALTEARAQLGKRLFFDPRLSRDHSLSCGSCHLQEHGFADPRPVSLGVEGRQGKRNASHLANLAWVRTGLFWDGREPSLEDQVVKPIEDPLEMDLSLAEAAARVAAEPSYQSAFVDAYEAPPSVETLKKALASFVRTLVSSTSRYDRFLAGDEAALSAAEKRGRAIFLSSQGKCFHCHTQDTLTNDGFFNNGTFVEGGDPGRQSVTGRTGDLGKFRVPNLRNVEVTAPYMHDGSLATLEDVVRHYNEGGRGHPTTDVQIVPLGLTAQEQADLVAFMKSFTDEAFLKDRRFQP